MTARDFCYWLQGKLEIDQAGQSPAAGLTPAQVEVIRNHLNLVFIHDIDTPDPTGELQDAHDGEIPKRPKHARC